MSVEQWKSVCDIGTVVALFLAFAFGVGVWFTGNIINEKQTGQLKQFDTDLTGAKSSLAIQQERAAKADALVAGLEQDAAGAKTEMAKQQERAANAERRLLELQESTSWRTPNRALVTRLAPPLQRFAGQRYSFILDPADPERDSVLGWIVMLLGAANWKAEVATPSPRSELTFQATNIVLWVSPTAPSAVLEAARALVPAMERGGLPAVVLQSGWGPKPDAAPPELIRVVIFKRGPRMTVTGNMITFEGTPTQLLFGDGDAPH